MKKKWTIYVKDTRWKDCTDVIITGSVLRFLSNTGFWINVCGDWEAIEEKDYGKTS